MEIRLPLPSHPPDSQHILMFSVFAQRLPPSILRTNVSHITLFTKAISASQSRFFFATRLKQDGPAGPHQPPETPKDDTWGMLRDFSNKVVGPRPNPEDVWRARSEKMEPNPPPSVYTGSLLAWPCYFTSSNLFLGRSVRVKNNVAGSIRLLSRILQENRVLRTWKYQMRHEKKGVKRRRLKSQRWRRRFAHEVCFSHPARDNMHLTNPQVRKKIVLVRSIQRRGQ